MLYRGLLALLYSRSGCFCLVGLADPGAMLDFIQLLRANISPIPVSSFSAFPLGFRKFIQMSNRVSWDFRSKQRHASNPFVYQLP